MMRTWLLLTKNSSDPGWIADQYDDDLRSSYNWNHKVPNRDKVQEGDRIALWDGEHLLGISIIDSIIISENQEQEYQQCPSCFKGLVNPPRILKSPRYVCKYCHKGFEEPAIKNIAVKKYKTNHRNHWIDVPTSSIRIKDHLKDIAVHPKAIHSIRELKTEAFDTFLVNYSIGFDAFDDDMHEHTLKKRTDIPETEKSQQVMARRGQGAFRNNVFQREVKCRITGVSSLEHLRASHIKPWRLSNDIEKLDGNNGLLLSPHVDHLFDQGYISFEINGSLLVSPNLSSDVLVRWKIDQNLNAGRFSSEQENYLQFHRKYVFKK